MSTRQQTRKAAQHETLRGWALLQAMPELHIGLRTGFCGSLTTFASWVYLLLLQLVGGLHLPTVDCW